MPIVQELKSPLDPHEALRHLAQWRHPLLFESASLRPHLGRYSFLTADPMRTFLLPRVRYGADPLIEIEQWLKPCSVETIPGLPPFQGGAAGLIGFEAGGAWERFPRAGRDEFGLPDLAVGIYDWVLAWDHQTQQAWIISHGITAESSPSEASANQGTLNRDAVARKRVEQVLQALATPVKGEDQPPLGKLSQGDLLAIPTEFPQVFSTFTREDYLAAVQKVIDYIHAGDVFQVNLAQRLLAPATSSPLDLYGRLRQKNPAPFAAYYDWNSPRGSADSADAHCWSIISASPERFMALRGREVETRPIKGTRRRSPHPAADLFTRDALRESDKDLAENTMIVDLLRNDLSRVCQSGSIRVPQFCGVETYQTVQHLVSEIRGRLQPEVAPLDLIRAAFPGGSITGAPKVRAVEIISELEPTVRGPYCGSLFYLGFDGTFDSNLLIRTLVQSQGWWQFPVGGGIVSDSDPQAEYEETLHKAAGMLDALSAPSISNRPLSGEAPIALQGKEGT